MRKFLLLLLALQCALALLLKDTLVHAIEADDDFDDEDENSAPPSFWDFVVKDGAGTPVSLHDFRDAKAILVVNVASACGYTDQNYKELQALYEKYHARGLQILAFPCNQFGAQEPHDNQHILQFVQDQYKVSFPIFAKIDVNGDDQHPLFDYLKTALPGFLTNDIKWNFTKFLVVNGVPTKRYSTVTSPFAIESDILEALGLAAPRDEAEL